MDSLIVANKCFPVNQIYTQNKDKPPNESWRTVDLGSRPRVTETLNGGSVTENLPKACLPN